MASSFGAPALRLRAFFEEKRREVYFRAQREAVETTTTFGTGEEQEEKAASKYSEARLKKMLGFVGELESMGDSVSASAFVDLMRAYLTRGSAAEVAGLGASLFGHDEGLLKTFSDFVSVSPAEVLALEKKKKPAKRGPGRPAGATANTNVEQKRQKVVKQKKVWRVEGDEKLGHYFFMPGKSRAELAAICRVDAFTHEESKTADEVKKKAYRGTVILGPQQGTLVETTEDVLFYPELLSVLKLCEDLPSDATTTADWTLSIAGGSNAAFVAAAKRYKLDAQLQNLRGWSDSFGTLVWAQDKASEPPWPSLILDPRLLEDDSPIADRAANLLGKKHIVRFLGMPQASSLGFIAPKKLEPLTTTDAHSSEIDNLKRIAQKAAFQEALKLADNILKRPNHNKIPVPGDILIVNYDGDDTQYRCTLKLNPLDGSLFVTSLQFPPEDQIGIPFSPDEDEWTFCDQDTPPHENNNNAEKLVRPPSPASTEPEIHPE